MKQTVSYGADIIGMSRKTLEPTVRVFRDAVSFLIDVVDSEWGGCLCPGRKHETA